MDCPKCRIELTTCEVESLELDLCPECGGTWFDQDELRKAKDMADANLRWMDFDIWRHEDRYALAPGLQCPRCAVDMCSLDYDDTGVRVDTCATCGGVWLDRDEFERIIRSLEDELSRKPTNELLAASLREALEVVAGPRSPVSEWRDLRQLLRLLSLRLAVDQPGLQKRINAVLGGTPFS